MVPSDPGIPTHPALQESGFAALFDLLQNSPLMVGLFDPGDRLCWANQRYADCFLRGLALPVPFFDVLRHGFHGGFGVRIDCGDVEQFLLDIGPRRRGTAYRAFATDLVDNSWLWMTETLSSTGWLLSVASDITALKRQEHSLQQAHAEALRSARTDVLTGASNRRHIFELGQHALEQSRRERLEMSVALLDLDHFKAINDVHGHQSGDEVLKCFVQQCRQHLRPGDSLGRIGGEEFLLLLPGAGLAAADMVVSRLRAGLTVAPGELPSFTFSAGLAQARGEESLQDLLERADQALYKAKHSGRNRNVSA